MAYAKIDPEQIIPGSENNVLTTSGGVALWAAPTSAGGGAATFRTWAQHLSDTVEGMVILRDAPYIAISDGGSPAAWVYWHPDAGEVTIPPSSGWTGDNNGSASVSATYGYIYSEFAHSSSSINCRIFYRSAPTPPYTIRVYMKWDLSGIQSATASANRDAGVMLGFRNTAGRLVSFMPNQIATDPDAALQTDKWTTTTSFSLGYKSAGADTILFRGAGWFEISDNNTNLIFRYSLDGNNFVQFDSRSRTDFLTSGPDHVFFGGYSKERGPVVEVLSWEEY